jgi:hypothetical protein
MNQLGQPVYELYPNPVNPTTMQASIVSKWPQLMVTNSMPQVSYALDDAVIYWAKWEMGTWAAANVGRIPGLQSVNWVWYCNEMKEAWRATMLTCCKEDDEIMPSPKPFVYNGGFSFPLGGEFLQSHDISSIIPPI